MHGRYDTIGADWLGSEVSGITDNILHRLPSEFNETHRYLPAAVTPIPGYISYKVTPYLREIIDCFDIRSPVREVNIMKGTQIGYTTVLESIVLYYMFEIRTKTIIFYTAERDMANARVESNIIPMINQSGFENCIRSGDIKNARKTGKTNTRIQFEGGGEFLWFGVKNPNKMRSWSGPILLKDEIDAWAEEVGNDGCPDALTNQRAKSFPHEKKIFRGSTPLITDTSKIYKNYMEGDQRKYYVRCLDCGFPQYLGWIGSNKEGLEWGFAWDTDNGALVPESVRYRCRDCGHEHFEHDKERLFSEDHGAEWRPTAKPKKKNVRSYHLPATMSALGMCTWADCVQEFLDGWDPVKKKIINIGKYQSWKNNIRGIPHEVKGDKVQFQQVSAHRRSCYRLGEIPNKYAEKWSGSKILMLTCTVDVQKHYLSIAVFGWCKDQCQYLIDYLKIEDNSDDGCGKEESPAWGELTKLIEEKRYTADDGTEYHIAVTFIDSGYNNNLVVNYCHQWGSGVVPILGRARTEKNATIKEFWPFKTQIGTSGLKINVDHYKERIAPVLRREWHEEAEVQERYHFNAPVDLPDDALIELTKETRKRKVDEKGHVSYFWHRPDGSNNELWDELVYAHCAFEFLAWSISVEHYGLESIDWDRFYEWLEKEQVTFKEVG